MGKFNGGFGGGGNMQNMLRQAQKLQEDMQKAQEQLHSTEFEGAGGGDLVKVVMMGDRNVVSVTIKPEAVDPDDIEMLEDLIMAAIQDATEKVEAETARVMGPYTSMLGGFGGF